MHVTRRTSARADGGQVVVLFALALPLLFAMSAFVIGIGNWFVHAKHLQTKADAGALAGGGAFEFPCAVGVDAIDLRIAALARLYAGSNNPQVGGVPNSKIHTVINGPAWYDDDSNPSPVENLDICRPDSTTLRVDVKVTEDNSFPLASLIPLFPDIKRKAVVELEQAEGASDLLPIAVRAPEPVSALAIFYNEANGTILDRRYLVKKTAPGGPGLPGVPAGLQGWSTENAADVDHIGGWASFPVAGKTGLVIGIAYRGACNTWGPAGKPPGVTDEPSGPCLEDGLGQGATTYTNINTICNQGGSVQVMNCYFATGTFPSETVQSGLHFIRGYIPGNLNGPGAPVVRNAYLTPGICTTGYGSGYFASYPAVCGAGFSASVDAGSCYRVIQGSGWTGGCVPSNTPNSSETRIAANVETKYTLVYGTGNNDDICNFGNTCDLAMSGNPGNLGATGAFTAATLSGHTSFAVGLRIRLKDTAGINGQNCGGNNFSSNCQFFVLGSGTQGSNVPSDSTIFNDPVQRVFRGNTVNSGNIKWLRMKSDQSACGTPPSDETFFTGQEGSQQLGATSCFVVEMGLKGGIATDASDTGVLFSDGVGASQMGYLDCTASGPQNIVWELMNGCPPLYAPNKFNTNPYCPSANTLFNTPNPGSPFVAPDWPPLRCVKTRPTSQGSDLVKGLNGRFFFPTDPNPPPNAPNTCPAAGPGYVQGRNYWKHNPTTNPNYGYADAAYPGWVTHFDPKDSRLVTIFLTTPESFTGSGQSTFPVTGAIGVYITGYGHVQGQGNLVVDDPCADPAPPDVDLSGGGSGGRVVWGHFINLAELSANATPSGVACNPGGSTQVCVPVLVE